MDDIATDMLLEHALRYLCDYDKLINLHNWQNKLKTYNKMYTRDTNIIISDKTYKHYFDVVEKMMPFILAGHNNSTNRYYIEKNNLNSKAGQKKKQTFDILNLINKDLSWKQVSVQFFYERLLYLKRLCLNSFYSTNIIPTCLFPLFYSVIAAIKSSGNNWKLLKECILSNAYCFFHQFNGLIPNQQHDKEITKDILPFSTENIFSFYYVLLEHYFPNELFDLAETAQDTYEQLIQNCADNMEKMYFRSNMQKYSWLYFYFQANNAVFSAIREEIISCPPHSQYTHVFYYYPHTPKEDITQYTTLLQSYSTETALQQWTEIQKNLLNNSKSILANAKKCAEQKWEKKNR